MREENKKLKILSRRAFVLGLFKGSIFAGLIARYYYLQVLESEHYSLLSDKNRIHIALTPPIRGNILSADGKVIAGNRSSHQLVVQIRKLKELDGIAQRLGDIMRNPNYLDSTILARAKANFLPNHYITLKNDLTWEEIARLSGAAYNIPEVLIIDASMRYYPYGAITAHISGYVASLNAKEQEKHQDMRGFNAKVGKNGAERQYQDSLQGKPGIDKVEVNVLGSKIRNIASQPSVKGADIRLSLNMELQMFVHEALANRQGSVVVMDIESGKIIAMQSTPSYDPNLFVNGISNADWQELINNANSPLINKAISFTYPPGSTFKPISALTLLSAGVDPLQRISCNGEYVLGNRVFHCWKWKYGGHGLVDLNKSIAASCNVYYYSMASRIGINKLHKMASMLGMGSCSGIELPFEVCGLMPSKQWKAQRLNAPWTAGDTVNSIIGQGYNSATILQLAVMVARIASGMAIKPTILNQEKVKPFILDIDEASLSLVRKGMYNSLNSPEGTGYNYRLPYNDFALAGKTGTAQIASLSENNKLEDHGLFIGFAPFHQPKFAIATIVEHGKWGSQSAAPLSASIMRFIRENLNLF